VGKKNLKSNPKYNTVQARGLEEKKTTRSIHVQPGQFNINLRLR